MLDALNVGMLMMGRRPEAEVEKAVYLPKNHFIKEESMATDKYLSLFCPFDRLDLVKKGIESTWNVSGDQPLRLCKHCQKVFLGSRSNAAFCSPRCKNQYNVYKSRGKNRMDGGDEE